MRRRALIAIVDDDASAREAMVSLVAAMGFNAAGFASAAGFLGSDARAASACLISDIRMPGMTGLDLHRHLVASGQPIPTILTTAYPDDATKARALDAGVHGYLAKPFDPEALLSCIRAALRAGRLSQRSG